nr:receptor expression-enhancing protein 3 isoform X2 [Mirounga angustirostris]
MNFFPQEHKFLTNKDVAKSLCAQVRWMMYWIVFALYTVIETVTDQTVAWFPLYYELKIAFVVWLLSPYTKGASLIYRKFLHPLLSSKEREIDDYIVQAKERGYETVVSFGRQGLAFAATAAVTAAVKVTVQFQVLPSVTLKPRDKVRWLYIPDHYKILAEFCFRLIFVKLERTRG